MSQTDLKAPARQMSGIWIKRRNREKWRGSDENTPARRSIQLNYSYPSCSGPPPPPHRAHVPTNPAVGQGNKPRQLTINHRCLSRHWNDVKHCICVIVHLFQSLGCHLTNCEPPVRSSARLSVPPRAPFHPITSTRTGRDAARSTHFPVNREWIVAGYIN